MYDLEGLNDSSNSSSNYEGIEAPDGSPSQSNHSDSTIIETNSDLEDLANKYIQRITGTSNNECKTTANKSFTTSYGLLDRSPDSEGDVPIQNNIDIIGFTHASTSNNFHTESGGATTSTFTFSTTKSDLELDSIIKKYTSSTNSTSSEDVCSGLKQSESIVLNSNAYSEPIELSSDDELGSVETNIVASDIKTCILDNDSLNLDTDDIFKKYSIASTSKEDDITTSIAELLENNPLFYNSPKKKRKINEEKENRKMEKAAQQAKKREENERAKKFKQALVAANKNIKPEESIKFITAFLDTEIANEKYGGEILNALQAIDASYRLQPQLIPHTVTWNRRIQKHFMNDSEELTETSEITEIDEVLLIMNWDKIVELIHNQSLVQHVESIKSILGDKKLTLAIYGLENYFRFQKSQKQKEMRSEVTQTQTSQKNKKHDSLHNKAPKISKKQLEISLTNLQVLCCCCHRLVENSGDLGSLITQYTKAIAQAPYKLEKCKKQLEADWYMCGDNRDCVRVDKDGHGLQRLWQQQLTAFPLVRLEHAEAIAQKYPSPLSLMLEYCDPISSRGEKLLQDIPIRRAAGPLTTVRKIGPELSKKIYTFFTATDGDTTL